ncbi:MAG: hypothetical protein ACQKBV_12230 [Puniceicoccales bacterium]
MMRFLSIGLYWLASFIGYFVITVFIGAVVGAILFATVGALTHPHLEMSYRLAKGVLNGAKLAGIWVGAISISLCFMQGHRNNQRRRDASEEAA